MTATNEFTKKIKSKYSLNEAFSSDKENSKSVQKSVHTDTPIDTSTSLVDDSQIVKSLSTPFTEISKKYTPQGSKYTKKMTLNVTEEAYNQFQKIYATRLLEGRATEKGDLIGECIELLFLKEIKEKI